MILVAEQVRAVLRANAAAAHNASALCPIHDPAPVLKLFSPVGAATWLATELHNDGDTLFGLADLGFGCPELGCFSLAEIAAIRLPCGLRIERDLGFATTLPLSVWADAAHRSGSIIRAETRLRHPPRNGVDPKLPHQRG